MKQLILLGCLSAIFAGSVTQSLTARHLTSLQTLGEQQATAAPSTSSTNDQRRDVFYFSDRFGFRFVSPQGYIITPSVTQPATKPAKPLEVLELWQQADFSKRDSLPETPPVIRITVYDNAKQLPLTYWKGELSHNDDQPLKVARQNAIAYTSTGLYESDNVLVNSPNRRYVFRLTVGYMDAKASIRKTFQNIVSSFTFDVKPDSKSASKWQVDYNQLRTLLATKDWQAANLETRAILQRLAGSKADLLFNSKSVLPNIPLADLKMIDTLWSQASGGRFGFSTQKRVWQQAVKASKNSKAQVEQFAQQVGWRRTQPLPENNPVGVEISGTLWRLDSELNYTTSAPVGHLPWFGVSSSRLVDYLNERSLGCGSCTIDAIYLSSDRFSDYLPALFSRLEKIKK